MQGRYRPLLPDSLAQASVGNTCLSLTSRAVSSKATGTPFTSRTRPNLWGSSGAKAMTTTVPPGVIADHVAAVNASDTEAIMTTFADDAYVNDNRREFRGAGAVRRFIEREIVGHKVTMDVREVIQHHGDTIVRAAYDAEYDRTNLSDAAILSNYFSVRDGKIVSLVTTFNQPAVLKQ
jgi:hypothetical protein